MITISKSREEESNYSIGSPFFLGIFFILLIVIIIYLALKFGSPLFGVIPINNDSILVNPLFPGTASPDPRVIQANSIEAGRRAGGGIDRYPY